MKHPAFDILGFSIKDKVTGMEGVATSASFDLSGCVQILLRPKKQKDKDKLPEAMWFDLSRLQITSKKRVMEPVNFRSYDQVKVPGPENKPVF